MHTSRRQYELPPADESESRTDYSEPIPRHGDVIGRVRLSQESQAPMSSCTGSTISISDATSQETNLASPYTLLRTISSFDPQAFKSILPQHHHVRIQSPPEIGPSPPSTERKVPIAKLLLAMRTMQLTQAQRPAHLTSQHHTPPPPRPELVIISVRARLPRRQSLRCPRWCDPSCNIPTPSHRQPDLSSRRHPRVL